MMTRKDYVEVARIIHAHADSLSDSALYSLVQSFADYMETDNPRFQRTRFYDACLTGDGVKA